MIEPIATPRIEKRMLPLLDVTMALIGVLILMIGLANEEITSGEDGQLVRLETRLSGDVVFKDRVVASNSGGIHDKEFGRLLDRLENIEDPLILVYYPSPAQTDSSVDADLIGELMRRLVDRGYLVKTMERKPNSDQGGMR